MLQAVLLNTAGGITDGDVLRTGIAAQPGARMVVATAAAERIYKARIGAAPARVDLSIDAGDASRIAYLPQETILFDRCALDRNLRITLAADAIYLGIETLVFGRAESGERLRDIRLRDRIELRRGNRLVLYDAVRMTGPVARLLQSRACASGAGAIAALVFAGPDAAVRLDGLREAMADEDVAFGASVRDDLLMGRIAGRDSQCVRQAILMALSVLGKDWPLPAVWRC